MTQLHYARSRRTAVLLAGAIAMMMMATAAAQAFTFNDQANGSSDNAAKFTDPADRAKSRMTGESGDKSTIKNGNTTLQFGGRESFDQRNTTDRYFTPNSLMGR